MCQGPRKVKSRNEERGGAGDTLCMEDGGGGGLLWGQFECGEGGAHIRCSPQQRIYGEMRPRAPCSDLLFPTADRHRSNRIELMGTAHLASHATIKRARN